METRLHITQEQLYVAGATEIGKRRRTGKERDKNSAKWKAVVIPRVTRLHPTFKRKSGIKEPAEKIKHYFMQLNATQVHNIYHLYKIDFELFGYSTEPYHQ